MADYFTPTVVQQSIADSDMTPLERLILTTVFQSEADGDGLYFFAEIALNEMPVFPRAALKAALDASAAAQGHAADVVRDALARHPDADIIEIDFTGHASWETIFQEIVRRSSTISEIVVASSFTCSRMRPDGFGGMVVLITADAILAESTEDSLAALRDEASRLAEGGHPDRMILALNPVGVRAAIIEVLIVDGSLRPLTAEAVTEEDIRAAWDEIAAALDLTDIRQGAEFKAAVRAIERARQRAVR